MFGICSILIPAGYSNDPYYYQSPHQPLTNPKETENAYLGRPSTAVWPVAEDPNREVITMDATLRDGDFRLVSFLLGIHVLFQYHDELHLVPGFFAISTSPRLAAVATKAKTTPKQMQ